MCLRNLRTVPWLSFPKELMMLLKLEHNEIQICFLGAQSCFSWQAVEQYYYINEISYPSFRSDFNFIGKVYDPRYPKVPWVLTWASHVIQLSLLRLFFRVTLVIYFSLWIHINNYSDYLWLSVFYYFIIRHTDIKKSGIQGDLNPRALTIRTEILFIMGHILTSWCCLKIPVSLSCSNVLKATDIIHDNMQ